MKTTSHSENSANPDSDPLPPSSPPNWF